MIEVDRSAPHLTDAEIEAYWKGGLRGADEDRVEEHYVECADCRARVAALETLIESLREVSLTTAPTIRRLRAWQLAAAMFAAMAIGVAWLWTPLGRTGGAGLPIDVPATAATTTVDSRSLAVMTALLAPPARGASGEAVVMLAADTSLVVFELDVREGNAPGSRFDVSLAASAGRVVLRLSEVAPLESGVLRVPVDASFLTGGQYRFTATAGPAAVTIPFLIRVGGSG